MIDLTRFCGVNDVREWMQKPFSLAEFTYATNGVVAIRMARNPDVPLSEKPDLGKFLDRHFGGIEQLVFVAHSTAEIPSDEEPSAECDHCDGSGRKHDCPNCDCICANCGGKGVKSLAQISTTFCGASFRLLHVREILSLRGCEIADAQPNASTGTPLKFRFDGGYGVIAPLHRRLAQHIDPPGVEAA